MMGCYRHIGSSIALLNQSVDRTLQMYFSNRFLGSMRARFFADHRFPASAFPLLILQIKILHPAFPASSVSSAGSDFAPLPITLCSGAFSASVSRSSTETRSSASPPIICFPGAFNASVSRSKTPTICAPDKFTGIGCSVADSRRRLSIVLVNEFVNNCKSFAECVFFSNSRLIRSACLAKSAICSHRRCEWNIAHCLPMLFPCFTPQRTVLRFWPSG